MGKKRISFFPKPLVGKQNINGHAFLDINEDEFTLISKKYPGKDHEDTNSQDILISHYDLNGVFLRETNLTFVIDDSKFKFAKSYLKGSFIDHHAANGYYITWTAAATGTVYYDKDDDTYLICAILDGQTKKDDAMAVLVKKDANDNEIWTRYVEIFAERPSKYDIEDTSYAPLIAGGKIFYRKTDYSSRNEVGVIIGVIDYKSGEQIKSTTLDKLKGITELDDTKGGHLYGRIIKDEISENVVLDPDAVLAYGSNDNVMAFLKAEQPETRKWYYAFLNEDASVIILKADYKSKTYRLYHFE